MTTTKSPSDLVSDYIQEYTAANNNHGAVVAPLSLLQDIQSSLESCFVNENQNDDGGAELFFESRDNNYDKVSTAARREEWSRFLNAAIDGSNGDSSDDDALRGDFIDCLVETVQQNNNQMNDDNNENYEDDEGNDGIISSISSSSSSKELAYLCLAYLSRLRCTESSSSGRVERSGRKKSSRLCSSAIITPPLFGEDFVTAIAPSVVDALQLENHFYSNNNDDNAGDENGNAISKAASKLLLALLHPHRPRNEICIATIRDLILLPASSSTAGIGSAACIAEVMSWSVVQAVGYAVPDIHDGRADNNNNDSNSSSSNSNNSKHCSAKEEELSMRRETSALTRMQDMRDVFMNVASMCAVGMEEGNTHHETAHPEEDDSLHRVSQRVLRGFLAMFEIAPFAVESQLETLLDGDAAPIVEFLQTNCENGLMALKEEEEKKEKVKEQNKNYVADGIGGGDETEEEDEEEVVPPEDQQLAPLYFSIAKPPAILTSIKQLELTLDSITSHLNDMDPELWDERLAALIDIECLLAGGVSWSMGPEARSLFIEKLRKMPLPEQLLDLRSQITQQACRVIVAVSYEFRDYVKEDNASLGVAVSHLVDCCTPAMLRLCCSGTRLMATQGMNALLSLAAVGGRTGYPRTIPNFCEDITSKKMHKNRKRGSVLALTAALRVWDAGCFVKHGDKIAKAVKEATTDRDPGVREDAKKLYWAMCSCEKLRGAAQELFVASGREMKQLNKVRDEIDAEWEEEGIMGVLVQTGVLGEITGVDMSKNNTTSRSSKLSAHHPRMMPPKSAAKRQALSSTNAESVTPKTSKFSTPAKLDQRHDSHTIPLTGQASSRKRPPPSARRSTLATPNNRVETPNRRLSARESTPNVSMGASQVQSARASRDLRNDEDGNSVVGVASSPLAKRHRLPLCPSTCPTDIEKMSESAASEMKSLPLKEIKVEPFSSNQENLPMVEMGTPAKLSSMSPRGVRSVAFKMDPSSPLIGTPIVNLLARASPISIEKVKNSKDALGDIVKMLSCASSRHEQYLGIQMLALFAKDHSKHPSWDEKFPLVLNCLIDQIKRAQTEDCSSISNQFEFIKSPTKKLNNHHEAQHLFLQGVRSLLQFVPSHVNDQVNDIVCCLLECTNNAPFEIVHTAERALHNLVTGTDPEICFECLIPYLSNVSVNKDSKCNTPVLLSALRTLRHLIDRISPETLKSAIQPLFPLFRTTLQHKSVDYRKATVFILVEIHFVLGDELNFDELSECQQRLIDVYIEKHPKKKAQLLSAAALHHVKSLEISA